MGRYARISKLHLNTKPKYLLHKLLRIFAGNNITLLSRDSFPKVCAEYLLIQKSIIGMRINIHIISDALLKVFTSQYHSLVIRKPWESFQGNRTLAHSFTKDLKIFYSPISNSYNLLPSNVQPLGSSLVKGHDLVSFFKECRHLLHHSQSVRSCQQMRQAVVYCELNWLRMPCTKCERCQSHVWIKYHRRQWQLLSAKNCFTRC